MSERKDGCGRDARGDHERHSRATGMTGGPWAPELGFLRDFRPRHSSRQRTAAVVSPSLQSQVSRRGERLDHDLFGRRRESAAACPGVHSTQRLRKQSYGSNSRKQHAVRTTHSARAYTLGYEATEHRVLNSDVHVALTLLGCGEVLSARSSLAGKQLQVN